MYVALPKAFMKPVFQCDFFDEGKAVYFTAFPRWAIRNKIDGVVPRSVGWEAIQGFLIEYPCISTEFNWDVFYGWLWGSTCCEFRGVRRFCSYGQR